jgi:hypothetical protein
LVPLSLADDEDVLSLANDEDAVKVLLGVILKRPEKE